MAGNGRKSKRVLVASYLARGCTVAEAAENARVGERTVYRYLHEPEFVNMLREFQDDVVSEVTGELKSLGCLAIDVLRKRLGHRWSEKEPGEAARFVLSTLVKIDASTREKKSREQQTELLGQQVQVLEEKNSLLQEEVKLLRKRLVGEMDDLKQPTGEDPRVA